MYVCGRSIALYNAWISIFKWIGIVSFRTLPLCTFSRRIFEFCTFYTRNWNRVSFVRQLVCLLTISFSVSQFCLIDNFANVKKLFLSILWYKLGKNSVCIRHKCYLEYGSEWDDLHTFLRVRIIFFDCYLVYFTKRYHVPNTSSIVWEDQWNM